MTEIEKKRRRQQQYHERMADPVYREQRRIKASENYRKRFANDPAFREKCRIRSRRYYRQHRKERMRKMRVYHAKNRDKLRKYDRQRYAENRLARIKKTREYRRLHPQRVKNTRLKTKYGLTLVQYQTMCRKQRGCCAICSKKTKLCVDHNYKTGVVRGLLCCQCNSFIGRVCERKVVLRKAIRYLER